MNSIRWTVGRRLAVGFAVAVLLLGTVGAFANQFANTLYSTQQQVTHTYEVLGAIGAVLGDLSGAETGQRGYLITGEDDYLAPYTAAQQTVGSHLDAIAELTSDNPDQQASPTCARWCRRSSTSCSRPSTCAPIRAWKLLSPSC